LKGHERAINLLKYNRDGDLLFTCSKDHKPCVWYSDNGERLGTYRGHNGAVWCLDVSSDSVLLATGAADNQAKLWDVETGVELFSFNHRTPVRSVAFSYGDRLLMSVTDQIMGHKPFILLYRVADEPQQQKAHAAAILTIEQPTPFGKIHQAAFGPLNTHIYTANEDGTIRVFDTETGKETQCEKVHDKGINGFEFATHFGYLLTASDDCTAKIVDSKSLKPIKTFEAGKPVNAAAISPILPHVILGGGQEAMDVTTTHARVGQFQTRFFHVVTQEEIGQLKGHFGPIHTLQFSPDGKSFASGAEDGYVRIHHFPQQYFESDWSKAIGTSAVASK